MNLGLNPSRESLAAVGSSRKRTRGGQVSSAEESVLSSEDLADGAAAAGGNPRKARKVSRACDYCKARKAKCSGTQPCDKCTQKGRPCQYDAKYSRGRPPTPLQSSTALSATTVPVVESTSPGPRSASETRQPNAPHAGSLHPGPNAGSAPASRASPEHAMAEIQGQVFDTTSGVTFLHRASRRLARQRGPPSSSLQLDDHSSHAAPPDSRQPVMSAGDLPLPHFGTRRVIESDPQLLAVLPPRCEAQRLLAMYFDVCVVTYLILHQPLVEAWLAAMQEDVERRLPGWRRVGTARAAIVLGVLAIAAAHETRVASPFPDPSQAAGGVGDSSGQEQQHHDRLFCASQKLVEAETGSPRLESAQARLIQTLYLLTTSRMNRAWYTFGNALQMISALGLHRKAARRMGGCGGGGGGGDRLDYIQSQLRIRTFWTAYILDKYIGVIMGRPRHYHDDDIDQVYPDRVDDEDVDAQGPIEVGDDFPDCHLDALICHAKIARIIGAISREVYSIKPMTEQARCDAARRLSQDLRSWKASLPPHLGAIRPSMLGGFYRRQSLVLRFAYCHGVMHANRLFLLSSGGSQSSNEAAVNECVAAAHSALEAVDGIAGAQSKSIQALWWTQYVAFHALVISYVWDIQRKRQLRGGEGSDAVRHSKLMALAERCQAYLAEATAANSPSRRYAVILEELRLEALGQQQRIQVGRLERSVQGATESTGDNNSLTAVRQPAESCIGMQQGQEVREAGPSGPALDASAGGGVTQDVAMVGGLDNMLFSGGRNIGNLFDGWQTTDWLDLDSTAFGFYIQQHSPEWMTNMGA
ncbi:hypothetical protein PspLS_01792 [Pyricularia sp. CBS 133598]|nr:hypothetical protein PspLS_01792 [Pyricularia sp. CBS 133598]